MWYQKTKQGVYLYLYILSGSKKNRTIGIFTDSNGQQRMKIKLQAPALDGKANQALIECLSKKLNVKRNEVSLIKGEQNPFKKVFIEHDLNTRILDEAFVIQ